MLCTPVMRETFESFSTFLSGFHVTCPGSPCKVLLLSPPEPHSVSSSIFMSSSTLHAHKCKESKAGLPGAGSSRRAVRNASAAGLFAPIGCCSCPCTGQALVLGKVEAERLPQPVVIICDLQVTGHRLGKWPESFGGHSSW